MNHHEWKMRAAELLDYIQRHLERREWPTKKSMVAAVSFLKTTKQVEEWLTNLAGMGYLSRRWVISEEHNQGLYTYKMEQKGLDLIEEMKPTRVTSAAGGIDLSSKP